ncbi:hypothetical protein BH10ACI1_BH10ACI1_20880 [soil metagenome]
MAIVKKREIEVMAQMNGEELEKALLRLPASREKLEDLFDNLETKLETEPCDHTSRFTMQFLMQKGMNFPKVSAWLSQNGGYCDCKIVEEIAAEWWKIFDNYDENFEAQKQAE